MKVPWQFAGNEEMYKLAVRLYMDDLLGRASRASRSQHGSLKLTAAVIHEIGDDLIAMGQEIIDRKESE